MTEVIRTDNTETLKNALERIADLEKENAVLHEFICDYKEQVKNDNETSNNKIAELEEENAQLKKKCYKKAVKDYCELEEQLTKAKEIILRLYNAGRDVLMCRAEEKAYDNLSNAINDKSIEQFLNSFEKK